MFFIEILNQKIIFRGDFIVKIADFGISRIISSANEKIIKLHSNQPYITPEIYNNQPYSVESDI
jgi:serine/threonine protein kinase